MKLWCLRCQTEFEEPVQGETATSNLAMCRSCCRASVVRMWDSEHMATSIADLFREHQMDCKPCADNGIFVPAFKVINGVGYCEPCALQREQQPTPPPSVPAEPTRRPGRLESIAERDEFDEDEPEREERQMQRKSKIDWEKGQAMRTAGKSAGQIAAALGCTPAAVYANTKAPKINPHLQTPPPQKRQSRPTVVTNGASPRYEEIRADLIAKRDELDKALEALESVKHLI